MKCFVAPHEPILLTKIAFDGGLYELSWKSLNENITNYTIFWCENERDRPYQCAVCIYFSLFSAGYFYFTNTHTKWYTYLTGLFRLDTCIKTHHYIQFDRTTSR